VASVVLLRRGVGLSPRGGPHGGGWHALGWRGGSPLRALGADDTTVQPPGGDAGRDWC
jgi:hypothetical protein